MAQNTLMFEVGVQMAKDWAKQLDELSKKIDSVRGNSQIEIQVKGLSDFVTQLKSLGSGDAIKPLLDRVESLQTAFVRLGMIPKDLNYTALESQLKKVTDAYTQYQQAREKAGLKAGDADKGAAIAFAESYKVARTKLESEFGMTEKVARATIETYNKFGETLASNLQKVGANTSGLDAVKTKMSEVGESVDKLHTKLGDGIKLNGDFSKFETWTQEVQSLARRVSDLVKQYENLSKAQQQGSGGNITSIKSQTELLLEQAKTVEDLKNKQAELVQKKISSTGTMPTVGIDKELTTTEQNLAAAQSKFNEMLAKGATETNSLAQSIQQLGQKYNLTSEQAQKLASIVANGSLERGNVQRGLGVGWQKAGDIVKTIEAVQKLHQEENKLGTGGNANVQQFTELDRIIRGLEIEVGKLAKLFTDLGNSEGLKGLQTNIESVNTLVGTLAVTLSTLSNSVNFKGSAEDVTAYETKLKALKDECANLEARLKNLTEEGKRAREAMKMVADGKSSEATQNTNMSTLEAQIRKVNDALARMEAEYAKMEAAGAKDATIEARIQKLRDYQALLEKVKGMDLSIPNVFKSTDLKFNGDILFGQLNKGMYSERAVKDFAKLVDETIKAKAAADSLNDAFERMKQKILGVGTSGQGGMRGVSTMMESINTVGERNIQTLIKEQAHVERLIAVAEKSIKFGEGHDIAGMGTLRAQQKANLEYLNNVRDAIRYILENRNVPEWMRFLNTSGSLKLPLPGSGNDIALLGGHFDKLTHSVTGTSQAMHQLNNEMRLGDNNQYYKTWNTNSLKRGLYDVEQAIDKIKAAWAKVSDGADMATTKSVAAMLNGLNDLRGRISSAMQNDDLLRSHRGFGQVMNADYDIQLKNAKSLTDVLKQEGKEREKAERDYMKEVERFTEQSKKAYAQAEKEKEKAAQERAKAVAAAEKQVQSEIDRTNSLMKKVDVSIQRGNTAGRDMSTLETQKAQLEQQMRLLEALKNSLNKGTTASDSPIIAKRIEETKNLRENTDLLRKSEEQLTAKREQANTKRDNAAIKNLQDEEKSVRDAWNKYDELKRKIEEVESLKKRGEAVKMDLSGIDNALTKLTELRQMMVDIINNGGRTTASYHRASVGSLANDFWKSQGSSTRSDAGKAISDFNKELTQTEAQSRTANANIRKLGMAFNDLKGYIKENGGSDEMRKLQSEIQGAIQKMRQLMNAGDYKGASNVYERVRDSVKGVSAATREYESAKQRASNATIQLTSEEQKLAQAISHSSGEMNKQSQVLSDLKMMAMQYLSVWGSQQFLHNIIEIGGQLEKQRLSIGAILGDVAHANDLFDKIKNLAVQSPFGVVELDQYTKQLTAYGFKYNELYDMTKRLADISAGAGTDVSRLTLALGHVRSEGALTGYTLRQFAMNNIPMLSQLEKKLSEVEHRVVTASDVRKRVSKKEIGYEDVVDVIKNMTNEGGMFYNMQETISQSIQSRFKNLKDSLDIMYGEIAESKIGDALKGLAVVLTDLSRNWKSFVPIIESAAISWGVYKAATLSVNMALGSNTAAVTSNILAYKKKRAEELQHEAMVRKLTTEEQQLVQTRNRLTASNIQIALSTGAMTKGEALKLVALRKVSLETTKALIGMGAFSAAEARMALNGRLLWMNLGKVGASLKLFGASAWSSIKNLAGSIFTPLNAAFAAFTVGMSANGKMNEFDEIRKSRRDAIREQANEGYKNLIEATKNFSVGASQNMSKTDINLTLDDMIDKLKEYSTLYNTTFNEAFKTDAQGHSVHSLAEQYEILAQSLEDAANAQKLFADMSDLVSHAIETSDPSNGFWKNVGDTLYGWMLSDDTKAVIGSLSDSLERYAQTTKEVGVAENLLLRDHLALRTALDGRGLGDVMNMANDELIRTLDRLRATMPDVFAAVRLSLSSESRAMLDDWTAKCNSMNEAYAAANLKMRRSGNDLYESMKVKFGGDMTKWPSEWREFVMMAMNAATKDVKGFADMSIDYQNLVRDSFLKPFGISVDSDEAKEKVNDLYVDLQNLVGKKWVIQVGVKGESAWDDLETSGKKYTESDKKVKQLEKNLKRLNYVPGAFFNSREAEKVAEEYNEAIEERRAAKILYESYGGDVSELDKSKNKKSGSKSEDKDARRLREIVKLYKDAYDWYGKYEKQVGEGSALAKVKEQFEPLFKQFEEQFKQKLSLDSIPLYKDNLVSLLDEAQKLYESPKHKNSYMVEAIKTIRDAINNVDYEEAQRKMDEYASRVQIELDGLTRAWDMFNNVRESTGDVELAVRIAGVGGDGTRNLAEDIRKKIENDLSQIGVDAIPFDFNFSDKDIQNEVEKAFEQFKPQKPADEKDSKAMEEYNSKLSEYQSKIKGFIEIYKKWRDLQRDVTAKDLKIFADLLGKTEDYGSKIRQLRDNLAQTLESIEHSEGTPAEKGLATRRAIANEEWEEAQLSSEFANLFENAATMSKSAFESEASYIEGLLSDLFELGLISPDKMSEWRDKVTKARSDYSQSGFLGIKGSTGAYLAGGYQGLIDYRKSQRDKMANDLKGLDPNSKEYKDKEAELKVLDGLIKKNEEAAKAMEQVSNAANTLKGGFDLLSDLFGNMGLGGASEAMSDASGVLGSAMSGASSLSALGPWGMAAGAGLGLVSGLFALHDKGIQRQIEAIQDEVDALDANTSAIKAARERTLGYDTGNLRKMYATQYQDVTKRINFFGIDFDVQDAAKKAMKEHYSQNTQYTGYKQEIENLKSQREKYMEMYNLENSKKKKSDDALDEYRDKIAELDDEISYYFEDLTKELWGIDFKAWASQISDALWTAFENGEDAVDAFRDTAKDIISDVAKNMANLHYMEPAFKALEDELFGTIDSNGNRVGSKAYNARTGELNEEETLRILGNYFGENGILEKQIEQMQRFYNLAEQASGFDFSSDDRSSSASSTIKGITEQTADLLCSYVNAIRADVSVDRSQFAIYLPMYANLLTSGNSQLVSINQHVAEIERSNASIERSNQAILDNINGLKNRTWKMPMA